VSALTYLRLALRDAHVLELRCCQDERWTSGLFSDLEALRTAIRERAGRGNLYISLNRPHATLAANRMGGRALTDADIERVVRIPVDFDPARPAECMATDAEVAQAVAVRDRFIVAMHAAGWPMPLTAMSGSGAHAMYRCAIPASTELREMLTTVYAGWRQDFATAEVGFDVKVRNPSRIFRLYGSTNRKGPDLPERPWRRASCTLPAGGWQAVQIGDIAALAERYARRSASAAPVPRPTAGPIVGAGDFRTLDVVGWMQAQGLYKRPLGAGKHAIRCPWIGEHSSGDHPLRTDTVVWEAQAGEWPRFYCSHQHCEGRGMRELIERLGDADRHCARAFAARAAA
jgi:hypothetical protein